MQDNLEPRCENMSNEHDKSEFWLKVFGIICVALLLVVVTAMLTFSLTVNHFVVNPNNGDKLSDTIDVVKGYLDAYAYFDCDEDARIEAAVKAYVSASDDKYSVFYNAEEFKSLNDDKEGRFIGIGVSIAEKEIVYEGKSLKLIEIINVYDNSPALDAGLHSGDLIYSVDTTDGEVFTSEVGLDVTSSKIKGEEGTSVTITILRPYADGYEKLDFTLVRRAVEVKSVTWFVAENTPSVGVVTITQFDLNTPALLTASVDALKEQNIKKIVIDMRDNGGGELNSVLACASYFLNPGDIIVSAEDKNGNIEEYDVRTRSYIKSAYSSCEVKNEDIGKYRDFEVAVLVNGNTASAAELLTAVFRDYGLAPVIGEQTFGKGTMQSTYSLAKLGVEGGIKFTTDLYYPPCGENYDGVGITPDIVVTPDESQNDAQLLAAIEELLK